jgi:hypothetical protein
MTNISLAFAALLYQHRGQRDGDDCEDGRSWKRQTLCAGDCLSLNAAAFIQVKARSTSS